ncbi:MAG: sulfatase-like hydrolase/transferase [Clostridia bacterium]|nr:sulfatase-like hydrolase/transferase [Clostridia bacterium]
MSKNIDRNKRKTEQKNDGKTPGKFKEKIDVFLGKTFLSCYLYSLALTIAVEIIARGSFVSAARFIFLTPHIFIYNHLIIFFFVSLTCFFLHRVFGFVLCGVIWLVLAITNCVLMAMRGVPFSLVDLAIFRYGIMLVPKYLTIWQLLLIFAGVGVVVFLGIFFWKKGGKMKEKPDVKKAVLLSAILFLLISALTAAGLLTGLLTRKFGINAASEFERSGYPYSLICASVTGMEKPKDYEENDVKDILDSLDVDKPVDELPNMIFIQLESFFDMHRLSSVELLKDPTPTFTELKKIFTNGYLSVPTFGGGTVNTEFEILSQMSLEFFSGINYPYESFLRDSTCMSIAYDLNRVGYSSHALHDYTGTFYSRYEVYKNLGFTNFTPIEYMNGMEYNQLGWARDIILEKYITKSLENTPGPDLVFAVSVQGHGGYNVGPEIFTPSEDPFVAGDAESNEFYNALEYYAEQINDMDEFISSLIAGLSQSDERTVVVVYGDHLPELDVIDQGLVGSKFDSEYVVWSNFDIRERDKNITAYQLFSYVQELVGMNTGMMCKFHQLHSGDDDYSEKLGKIEYGLLYGENGILSVDEVMIEPSDMKFGEDEIKIRSVWRSGDNLFIRGENFTEACHVMINGKRLKTSFINDNCLSAPDTDLRDGDEIAVSVRGSQNTFIEFGRSEPFVYGGEEDVS